MRTWVRSLAWTARTLSIGLVIAWVVAWVFAALRPTDGYPNVLGTRTDQWGGRYFLPQHRMQTSPGEVYVDYRGGLGYSVFAQAPRWTRNERPEDDWLLTTYPLPKNVPQEVLNVYGIDEPRERYPLPAWALTLEADVKELQIQQSAWGWPARCLGVVERTFGDVQADGTVQNSREELHGAWTSVRGWTNGRIRQLPTDVIWPGLLIDAAFWGAVMLAPVPLVRMMRQRRRRRRGACPSCGYSREGLTAGSCPECGATAK